MRMHYHNKMTTTVCPNQTCYPYWDDCTVFVQYGWTIRIKKTTKQDKENKDTQCKIQTYFVMKDAQPLQQWPATSAKTRVISLSLAN